MLRKQIQTSAVSKQEIESDMKPLILKKEPTIKISLFTFREACRESHYDFVCFTHTNSSSAAIVEHIPKKEEYVVYFGAGIRADTSILKNSRHYSKIGNKPVIILAYENEEKTFDEFKKICNVQFPTNPIAADKAGSCIWWKNCSTATTFAIDYFPRQPEKEPHYRIASRVAKKVACGFFGTFLGIRACDTCPGVTTPTEVEKRARGIEKDQQRFFAVAKGPERQTMEEHVPRSTGQSLKC